MSLIIAIATDLVAITVLAYVLYFRRHRRRDLLLSYVALNVGVFAVTMALSSVQVGIGLGIGLFGILSIIRLRSDQITQQEIAYYFVALALGLLTGLRPSPIWAAPALAALMLAVMFVVDGRLVASRSRRHTMTMDAAITDERELVAHLERALHAKVTRVEVLDVDLVRDTTLVDVRYRMLPASEPAARAPEQAAREQSARAQSAREQSERANEGRSAAIRPSAVRSSFAGDGTQPEAARVHTAGAR